MSYHTEDDDSVIYAIFAYPQYDYPKGGYDDLRGQFRMEDVFEKDLARKEEEILDFISDLEFDQPMEGEIVWCDANGFCKVATFKTDHEYWISEIRYVVKDIKWL